MSLRTLLDRVLVSDPALEGIRMGARTTLAAAVSAALTASLALPQTAPLLAGGIAMMLTFVVNDADLPAQRRTAALAPFAAALGLGLGTALSHHLWLSVAGFTVVLFVAVAAARWGKRAAAIGGMAQVSFFFALFFRAAPSELPALLAAVAIAGVVAWFVRFIVVRDRPAAIARHQERAFHAAVRLVLSASASLVQRPARLRQQRDALAAMNAVAMSIDAHVSPTLAARAYAIEVAVGRLATVARIAAQSKDAPPAVRNDLAETLLIARHDVKGALVRAAQDPRLSRALEHLRAAEVDDVAPSSPAVPAASPAVTGLDPELRRAIQAAVAAVLAMLAGFVISPERWAWAVITASVVLMGTTTRGDTLVKAAHRIGGTLAGVVAGIGLWHLVAGHPRVELALVFVSLFLAFAMMRVAYAWLAFWFTALLALLYGLLGTFSTHLLEVRIEETIVGATIGALVAVVVLPTRTRERVRAATTTLRADLGRFLARVLLEQSTDLAAAGHNDARALDRQVAELRKLAAPLATPLAARDVATAVHDLVSAVFIVRQLARPDVLAEVRALPLELRQVIADGVDARSVLGERTDPALAVFWLRELHDALHRRAP